MKSKRSIKQIDEELLPVDEGTVGCPCDSGEHAEGCEWIECTESNCHTWYCLQWVIEELQLSKTELSSIIDSPNIFKCLLHGFYDINTDNIAQELDIDRYYLIIIYVVAKKN